MKLERLITYFADFRGTAEEGTPRALSMRLEYNPVLKDHYITYNIIDETLFGLVEIDRGELYLNMSMTSAKKDVVKFLEQSSKIINNEGNDLEVILNIFKLMGGEKILDKYWPRWRIPKENINLDLTVGDSVV